MHLHLTNNVNLLCFAEFYQRILHDLDGFTKDPRDSSDLCTPRRSTLLWLLTSALRRGRNLNKGWPQRPLSTWTSIGHNYQNLIAKYQNHIFFTNRSEKVSETLVAKFQFVLPPLTVSSKRVSENRSKKFKKQKLRFRKNSFDKFFFDCDIRDQRPKNKLTRPISVLRHDFRFFMLTSVIFFSKQR